MDCIYNRKPEDRHCDYCSALCKNNPAYEYYKSKDCGYKCKDCGYFFDLPPDAGACTKQMGGRNGDVWGNDDICEDFELDKNDA